MKPSNCTDMQIVDFLKSKGYSYFSTQNNWDTYRKGGVPDIKVPKLPTMDINIIRNQVLTDRNLYNEFIKVLRKR